ncbi:hypothetical protein OSB04_011281 [Centaurea solstitialis]|uniref:Uncharacterized protein n=1 Tax=Centaurea solstitialis TaxID=347529 RepID=A0AA38WDJ4_9ASTR|nr:hypothetical protein OSB04_011281 [Centaurea solstitialis]
MEGEDVIYWGRVTLLKYVLGSVGSCLMSSFVVPSTVLKSLEDFRARLFCGTNIGDMKLHLVSWSQVVSVADRLRLDWKSSRLRCEPRGGAESA